MDFKKGFEKNMRESSITRSIKEHKEKIIALCIMLIFCFSVLQWLYGIFDGNLAKPILYDGGDDTSAYTIAKRIIDSGWAWETEYLGAPYGTQNYDFAPSVINIINLLIMKFFCFFTSNPFLVINLLYVSTFLMICIISYLVMLHLKLHYMISAVLSLVFAFMPYVFLRSVMHYSLATYQFVPISILLCIWIYRNSIWNKGNKGRTIASIFFCILIAWNGIAYYPFFTCILLMATGVGVAITKKKIFPILQAIMSCGTIVISLAFAMLPHFVYRIVNGSNGLVASRSSVEAEYLGLKIVQLLLPVNPSFGKIADIQEAYKNAPLPNEGSEYLGIIGIIGFCVLLVGLLGNMSSYSDNESVKTVQLLQKLNIVALLVGTIGGLGSAFALVVSPAIRCYNRISIFIAYICILTIAICTNHFFEKIKSADGKIALIVGLIVVSAISIYDQIPISTRKADRSSIYAEMESDKKYVQTIEKILPNGGMIYQLPNHLTPEMGNVNRMADYDQYKPYLYSTNLKWSYGAVKGRIGGVWNQKIASLPLNEMVDALCRYGYSGIYINREAYTTEKYTEIESTLMEILQEELIISEKGNLSFISLETYKKRSNINVDESEIPFAENPMHIKSGALGIEGQKTTGQWIWFDKEGAISICNFTDEIISNYEFSFNAITDFEGEYWVKITTNKDEKTYDLNSIAYISDTIDLYPGENIIYIETNAPKVYAPADPRNLYLRVTNFDFSIY